MVLWKTSALGKKREKNKLKDKVDGDEEKRKQEKRFIVISYVCDKSKKK